MTQPTFIQKMKEFHYDCQIGMYFSEKTVEAGVKFLYSRIVQDCYWNYAADGESIDVERKWSIITNYFKKRNRRPAIYYMQETEKSEPEIPDFLSKMYSDTWMFYPSEKSVELATISSVDIRKVKSSEQETVFAQTFFDAYKGNNPEDPYANLPKYYMDALKGSFDYTFEGFAVEHIIAYWGEKPVGVASAIMEKPFSGIYNVGVIPDYRNRGIGSLVTLFLVDLAKKRGIKNSFLQTETGSRVERLYKKIGFETIAIGVCYAGS